MSDIVKIRNKNTGEVLTLRRKTTVTQPKGFSDILKQRASDVEKRISERPSFMESLYKDPITFKSVKEHPISSLFRGLGGGAELTEGVAADVGLALQRGNLRGLGDEIRQTIAGARPAQLGDIFRGSGAPEPIASLGGLLASSYSGKGITAGLGKATKAKKIGEIATKPVARIGNIVSGVPTESIEGAIQNPQFLSRGWLSKTGKAVQDKYKQVIQPLIDNPNKRVNTSSLSNIAEETGVMTKGGEFGKAFTSMTAGEKRKFLNWEKQIAKGDLSFNEVDAIIGDIDSTLSGVYAKKAKGLPVDYSDSGIRVATNIRAKLNSLRKQQYPEAEKVLGEYENWSKGKNVFKQFDKWKPNLLPMAVGQAALGLTGLSSPLSASGMLLASVPKVQGVAIKAGSKVGELASHFAPQLMFEASRGNR